MKTCTCKFRYKDLTDHYAQVVRSVLKTQTADVKRNFPTTMAVNAFRGFIDEFRNNNCRAPPQEPNKEVRYSGLLRHELDVLWNQNPLTLLPTWICRHACNCSRSFNTLLYPFFGANSAVFFMSSGKGQVWWQEGKEEGREKAQRYHWASWASVSHPTGSYHHRLRSVQSSNQVFVAKNNSFRTLEIDVMRYYVRWLLVMRESFGVRHKCD